MKMIQVQVINGKITQHSLPKTGTLKKGYLPLKTDIL